MASLVKTGGPSVPQNAWLSPQRFANLSWKQSEKPLQALQATVLWCQTGNLWSDGRGTNMSRQPCRSISNKLQVFRRQWTLWIYALLWFNEFGSPAWIIVGLGKTFVFCCQTIRLCSALLQQPPQIVTINHFVAWTQIVTIEPTQIVTIDCLSHAI